MNAIIIIGIVSAMFTALCAITAIIEYRSAIYEWMFDVVTQYYIFKARRARKKVRK